MRRDLKYIIFVLIALLLLSYPTIISRAANSVAINQAGNTTSYQLSAVWTQLESANLSLSTDAGTTTITASVQAETNYTGAKIYAAIARDGTRIATYNLTSHPYQMTYSLTGAVNETAGDHTYALQLYCTAGKKCTVYQWNLTAQFIKTGDYSTTYNSTYDAYGAQITGVQANDTYFNGSVFPNSTNFRNNSLEPAISSSTANKFWGWDKSFKDILISYVSGLQETLNAMNTSATANNTASQGRDDLINTSFAALNNTVNGNLNNWNNTRNASYEKGAFGMWFDNSSVAITAGESGNWSAAYAGQITGGVLYSAHPSGSMNITFYNGTTFAFIGNVTISSGTNASATFSYDFAENDVIMWKVSSAATITKIGIKLKTLRS